jgi:hypothetical protein
VLVLLATGALRSSSVGLAKNLISRSLAETDKKLFSEGLGRSSKGQDLGSHPGGTNFTLICPSRLSLAWLSFSGISRSITFDWLKVLGHWMVAALGGGGAGPPLPMRAQYVYTWVYKRPISVSLAMSLSHGFLF